MNQQTFLPGKHDVELGATLVQFQVVMIFRSRHASRRSTSLAYQIGKLAAEDILKAGQRISDPDEDITEAAKEIAIAELRYQLKHIEHEHNRYCQRTHWLLVKIAKLVMWNHWQAIKEFKQIVEDL
jgi:hypothetical protein